MSQYRETLIEKAEKNILVVDSSQTNLVLLEAILSTEHYFVKTACSRRTALKIMLRWKPDMIIIDLLMPGLNEGLQFFNLIKKDDNHNKAKIVIVSALRDPGIINKVVSEGAAAYIFKPVDMEKVIEKVNKIIG